jgi:predicted AAA+ superfamily ATPase
VEPFYRTHNYLLEHLSNSLVRRELTDEINWNERLIGVKGSRGIGKTTFLLSYAKENYGVGNRECLYINMNHFFFTEKSLFCFVEEFRNQGGKTLLIDQVFKYPEWSKELRECYDKFPDIKIIFTGPSVMRLKEENLFLGGKVAVYNLRGFSFKEYLNLTHNKNFHSYKLAEVLSGHQEISKEISGQLKNRITKDFNNYLHHGFYPFYLEKRNYSENLLKTINMTLEVDVLYIRQIEQRYLTKLRKLFYLLSSETPCTPNVSKLSQELDMSRATIMNYIKYLEDARLVNMLYPVGDAYPKKPSLVYLYNTNLSKVVNFNPVNVLSDYKIFFYNQIQKDNKVNTGLKNSDFTINETYQFSIKENDNFKNNKNHYYTINTINSTEKNVIPLWLFGFLY